MGFIVAESILKETVHCRKNFACLLDDNSECLARIVDNCVDKKVIFLKCNEICVYKMEFGSYSICNCPTRREIYVKYNK
jgi:hypothetical protein